MSWKDRKVQVIDIHTCLQGEGKYMGVPHILIRMSGCNLNCQFGETICDTAYASWRPEAGKYTLQQIDNFLQDHFEHFGKVFITGGEPTINQHLLAQIVDVCKEYDYFVAIETNGTNVFRIPGIDFVTVSPKLSSSLPRPGTTVDLLDEDYEVQIVDYDKHQRNRVNTDALKNIIREYSTQYKDYQFKFVITNERDLKEVESVKNIAQIPRSKIWLMPEGITPEQIALKRPWVMETAIENGYNYSDRLHILAYGNKRLA